MKSIFRRFGLPHLVAVLAVALVLGSGTAYAAKQITSKNIKNNTIKSVDVKDGALTGTDIADGSISSGDILDGTITSGDVATDTLTAADLAANSVGTSEILDSTITTTDVAADTLTAADLAANSVGESEIASDAVNSAEIATDAVNATEVANDSIDSGEIVDFGLSNQDIGVLFAQVSAAGALDNSSGGVSVTNIAGVGTYEVDFGRNITSCAFYGTVGGSGTGTASGSVNVADRAGNVEAVFVNTDNSAGANADLPFHLLVVC